MSRGAVVGAREQFQHPSRELARVCGAPWAAVRTALCLWYEGKALEGGEQGNVMVCLVP